MSYLTGRSEVSERLHEAMTWWGKLLEWGSGEFLLTRLRRGNGGDVIALRALIVSLLIYFALSLLGTEQSPNITWFGTVFAASYAALYARFSQQWQYMANLYNTIKTTEVRTADNAENDNVKNRMAQWKAGYIEDADTLHLAMKPAIAAVICAWGEDPLVHRWFKEYSIGGKARLDRILDGAKETCSREEQRWRIA